MEKYKRHSKIQKSSLDDNITITIKTLFGLEDVLSDELSEHGFNNQTKLNRAVQITGSWRDVYYLNLHLRCALAILVEVAKFKIRDEDDLYKNAMKIDWTQFFDAKKTFAIKGAVHSTLFKHTQFPYFLVKDAIADTFRNKMGERPDVNVKKPQVMFDLYINQDMVTISLNTSGLPLYQRGYRDEIGEAPLNEVLAAGLLRISKWDKKTPLFDPFCGSGTILIEAALYASGIPSMIERQHYAFKNFANYQPGIWEELYDEALEKSKKIGKLDVAIFGSDLSDEMVLKSRRNLRGTAIGRFVEVKACSFSDVKPEFEKGIVITNPPYGERMGEEIEEMYQEMGDWMKNDLKGFDCWMISSSDEGFKSVGLKPDKKVKLYNGSLECSFRKYTIYAGSKRAKFNAENEI